MENYLKIEAGKKGSNWEIEHIEWVRDKTFDEIVEIGKEELEANKEWLRRDFEKDGEDAQDYIEEFCGIDSCQANTSFVVNIADDVKYGYYRVGWVKKLFGLDLNDHGAATNDELVEEFVGTQI